MKKLWILQPVDDSAAPWLSFHNCMFEFVVRASKEEEAREQAAKQAGDEGPDAWLSSHLSSCVELNGDGRSEVLVAAYNRAQ
jgi:hypothetical protein